jgi:hypothetical protein
MGKGQRAKGKVEEGEQSERSQRAEKKKTL